MKFNNIAQQFQSIKKTIQQIDSSLFLQLLTDLTLIQIQPLFMQGAKATTISLYKNTKRIKSKHHWVAELREVFIIQEPIQNNLYN